MSRQDHFANCMGCSSYAETEGCMNAVTWHGGPVPADAFCKNQILYRHPDGMGLITFERERNTLEISDERTGRAVHVPIGPRGLLELAGALIAEALKAEGR